MAEKREIKRKKKRLKLRFGVDSPKRVAFTEDISHRGLFIITGQPERPGQKVLIEMLLPNEDTVIVHGRVQWAKKVPPNLIRLANKGGMGVRLLHFESGEESYQQLVYELRH
ncbi:MAG: pilus assembly protein PilZ [Desulfuromonadaceae bacterium]|nr:pilus assembly protein PilZ [Desulfuromonadaceae bacterium]